MDNKTNTKLKSKTGTLKKPTEMPNTGSNIRTSTVLKGPHRKQGMSGGRKPPKATQSYPKQRYLHPKRSGYPLINLLTQKGGLSPRLCALTAGAILLANAAGSSAGNPAEQVLAEELEHLVGRRTATLPTRP